MGGLRAARHTGRAACQRPGSWPRRHTGGPICQARRAAPSAWAQHKAITRRLAPHGWFEFPIRFAEDLSAGVGSFGFSGDWLAANSRIIGGDSALTSEFWKLTGESISKWSLIGSVFLDVAQAGTTLGTPDSFYHSVDAAFDVGLSFLGPVGGGVGVIWTATGGFKGATQNPALNQDLEFGINP